MKSNSFKLMLLVAVALFVIYEIGDDGVDDPHIHYPHGPGSRKSWFKKLGRRLKKGFKKVGKFVRKAAEKGGQLALKAGKEAIKRGVGTVTGMAKEAIDTVKNPLKKAKEFYDIGKKTVVSTAKAANALAHGDVKKALYEAENAIEAPARKVGDEFTGGAVSDFEKKTGMKPGHFIENVGGLTNPKKAAQTASALAQASGSGD